MRKTFHKNAFLVYYLYKQASKGFNEKDFSDKIALFEHEGAIYVYQTSNGLAAEDADKAEQANQASKGIDRCITYLTVQKYWYDAKTMRVKFVNLV